MKQYQLQGDTFILKLKKSPLLIRIILLLLALFCLLSPIIGFVLLISSENDFQLSFLFGTLLFEVSGLYLMRFFLWNTYGSEIIKFNNNAITYEADYGWFKDAKKTIDTKLVKYSLGQIGYRGPLTATLIIASGESIINCATTMPIVEINELIEKLNIRT